MPSGDLGPVPASGSGLILMFVVSSPIRFSSRHDGREIFSGFHSGGRVGETVREGSPSFSDEASAMLAGCGRAASRDSAGPPGGSELPCGGWLAEGVLPGSTTVPPTFSAAATAGREDPAAGPLSGPGRCGESSASNDEQTAPRRQNGTTVPKTCDDRDRNPLVRFIVLSPPTSMNYSQNVGWCRANGMAGGSSVARQTLLRASVRLRRPTTNLRDLDPPYLNNPR